MPGNDGTGPMSNGQRGFGRGPCGRGLRRGYGQGFGRGFNRGSFGNGQGYFPRVVEFSKDDQKKVLENNLKDLEEERKTIEKKLSELNAQT